MSESQLITLRKILIVILILVNTSRVSAWMIEADVWPHQGSDNTEIVVNYSLNETVTSDARVKVYLNAYDPEANGFDYKIDETLIDYFEVDPGNLSPIILRLNSASGFYRICLKLAHDGKYYQDCDSGNQFLLIKQVEQQPQQLLKLSVETPEDFFVGEEFEINVTIKNNGDIVIEPKVYSYVYNTSNIILGSDSELLFLSPGSSASFILTNELADQGNYTLVVKAKAEDSVRVEKLIEVIQRPLRKIIFNNLIMINDSIRFCISNSGNVEENLSLRIYSSDIELKKNIVVLPKRSYEELINTSLFNSNVYFLLYRDGQLIDEQSITINETIVNVDEVFGLNKPDLNMEILLYSSIIGFSLIALLVLI